MKSSTVLWAILAVVLITPSAFAQTASFESALRQAKQENKAVAVYFHADAFGAPESLEDAVPDDWIIQSYLDRNYITVSIDADSEQGSAIADQYVPLGVYPALALVNSDGEFQAVQMFDSGLSDAGEWARFFLMLELGSDDQKGD